MVLPNSLTIQWATNPAPDKEIKSPSLRSSNRKASNPPPPKGAGFKKPALVPKAAEKTRAGKLRASTYGDRPRAKDDSDIRAPKRLYESDDEPIAARRLIRTSCSLLLLLCQVSSSAGVLNSAAPKDCIALDGGNRAITHLLWSVAFFSLS